MEYRITITSAPFDGADLAAAKMELINRVAPDAGAVATLDTDLRTIAVTVSIDADDATQALHEALMLVRPQILGLQIIAVEAVDAAADDAAEARDAAIRRAIDLLEQTRSSFKSKQVAQAREILEGLLLPAGVKG